MCLHIKKLIIMQHKLFWYYGAKTAFVDDIIKLAALLYSANRISTFVDVFGGAGNVLLNLPFEWRVNRIYNDIDNRLYNLMLDLQDEQKRNILFDKLFWCLSSRQIFEEFKAKEQNDSFEFLYRIFNSCILLSWYYTIASFKQPFDLQSMFFAVNRNYYISAAAVVFGLSFAV